MCLALLQTEKSAGKKTKIHAFQRKEIKYVMIHSIKCYSDYKVGKGVKVGLQFKSVKRHH